jgi:hypothetical protein
LANVALTPENLCKLGSKHSLLPQEPEQGREAVKRAKYGRFCLPSGSIVASRRSLCPLALAAVHALDYGLQFGLRFGARALIRVLD